ncbi:hypothetical protein ACFQH2_06235 [Natronoarchaeum sp. GCM10025703]|uniref:hypothetical protein n=1 Tax=Natronoarchaeum sp. GCM10025703 TaxID=3252685 RepID=UPI00361F5638
MTDPTDDGWPDKYSDPRDRPHPSVLRVTVESFDELREDVLDAAEAVSEGRSSLRSSRSARLGSCGRSSPTAGSNSCVR